MKLRNSICGILIILSTPVIMTHASAQNQISQDCRNTAKCWAKAHLGTATNKCTKAIEEMMESPVRWTEGMLDWRFNRYLWADAPNGVITYMSNAMEIEFDTDTWIGSLIECDFNGDTMEVVEVRQR